MPSLVQGLLAKRDQLRRERVGIGERMAILANDIEAIERVLHNCGYTGQLPEADPKSSRYVIFHRGELRSYILKKLRSKGEALTPRELATRLCKSDGRDGPEDSRLLTSVTKRIGDTLRKVKKDGIVTSDMPESAKTPGAINSALDQLTIYSATFSTKAFRRPSKL